MTTLARLSELPAFTLGVTASIAASVGTGIGALPVLAVSRVSRRAQDVLQSFAAGIMLSATVLSLVLPGIDAGSALFGGRLAGALAVAVAVVAGAAALLGVHRHAPHEHLLGGPDGPVGRHVVRRTWLIVAAITLHNFPEGMAVGVGFGGEFANGVALTGAIFVQNLPEGFIVALGLLAAGYRRRFAIFTAFATGLVETVGGLVGAATVAAAGAVLPWAMGFAAGAMLFVVSHEIIPETHRNGFEVEATSGLILGFVAMVVMGAALG
jgi:ZIP family zinc transporter